jgi:hypothetical protein
MNAVRTTLIKIDCVLSNLRAREWLRAGQLTVISARGQASYSSASDDALDKFAREHYNLGIFTFRKADR